MKNLRLVVLAIATVVTLSGCANVRQMSDYELCQTMSGQTLNAYASGDAGREMQQRAANGTATLSPSDCAQIALVTGQQYQQQAAAMNDVLIQQQAIQAAQQPKNVNVTVNRGMGW
ncbi:hypothetical protein OQC17_004608 [Salmonella enterica]|nr:hypothetical protein [Salmonella enterica]